MTSDLPDGLEPIQTQITFTVTMSPGDVRDVLIAAYEHKGYGSFAYRIDALDRLPTALCDISNPGTQFAAALLAGHPVSVCPIHEVETTWMALTRSKLAGAYATGVQEHPHLFPASFERFVAQHDVVGADAWVQIAALGKIVYG